MLWLTSGDRAKQQKRHEKILEKTVKKKAGVNKEKVGKRAAERATKANAVMSKWQRELAALKRAEAQQGNKKNEKKTKAKLKHLQQVRYCRCARCAYLTGDE